MLPEADARVIELYYDIGPQGEMHHNPAKNVLWIAREPDDIARQLAISPAVVGETIARARALLLAARDLRPTPYIDTTLYTSWNAMFISAYLAAAQILDDSHCRAFALRTLDRFLAEAWDDVRGFAHRLGGQRLDGSLDDQVFMAAALLDAFECTFDRRYFDAAERAVKVFVQKFGDAAEGGFFDRSSDAAPMGGLDVRRKPLQDSPTPGGNAVAAIVLERMYDYTANREYRERADATLAAFAGRAAEYGLFAGTYGLASALHARHPIQVVVTGTAGDEIAEQIARAAQLHYRFGLAVLRITPGAVAPASASAPQNLSALPPSLQSTLPHVRADQAQAFVCAGGACYPPVKDPRALVELLARVGSEAGAAAG